MREGECFDIMFVKLSFFKRNAISGVDFKQMGKRALCVRNPFPSYFKFVASLPNV